MEIMGFPVTQMDCMVPRRPLGKPVFPRTPLKKWISRLFPVFGKLGEGPPGPLCISYGPFEGLAILSSYLGDPSQLYWLFAGLYPHPTPHQAPVVAARMDIDS